MTAAATASTLLFVPGDRPNRFDKAAGAGADLVVLDLEDAVGADAKPAARRNIAEWAARNACAVRVNGARTEWFHDDLRSLVGTGAAVMLPEAENLADLAMISDVLGIDTAVIALIESARGVLNAAALAAAPNVVRLGVGTFDLAAQLGIDPLDTEALLPTRGALVLASAAARLAGPVDGVTAAIDDPDRLAADTTYARRLGFTGKLCIHPRQLAPVASSFAPSDDQLAWAQRIVDAFDAPAGSTTAGSSPAVAQVDGEMVDKPVVDRARAILARR
ncbi:HpcH/HpaI aldolase/citrate lyase family protein [Gordonia liuliyuniae]|uniref:CoA ester lyase n=1 Tax=Gordonia liuliyuniae TaxID=2911517 RepID=A0ABS9ITN0_9ACTN|nr:CoA ester lyase [Gordonia liuliyuniae]MCF8588920.1 CoA ester lyase [Gordonia liuliyuniae]